MTRLSRLNGTALLTLVAALLVATWPFFGTFTVAAVIAGFFLSLQMRTWHTEHPATDGEPQIEAVHPGINMASIPVRGDGAGLLFAAGSVAILLALPQIRWFLIASVICAAVAGFALVKWHARASSSKTALSIRRA
jgi:hypothetical protein